MHGIVEILLLVFVLLSDIGVYFNVLSLLVLDVLVETVVDDALELFVIIDVLDHPVDSVLEATDG